MGSTIGPRVISRLARAFELAPPPPLLDHLVAPLDHPAEALRHGVPVEDLDADRERRLLERLPEVAEGVGGEPPLPLPAEDEAPMSGTLPREAR